MLQLKVHIKPEKEDDKQEIDSLSRNLRDDLSNLDQVEDVQLSYEKPPPDSRALDGVTLGSMVIDIVGGKAVEHITQTVQRWIERNENRTVTIVGADGQKIELKGVSGKDQGKVIDAWVTSQKQKMNVKNE
jgi:hypothetical protein